MLPKNPVATVWPRFGFGITRFGAPHQRGRQQTANGAMATALNGLVHLIPFGRAFSTGSRLTFGGTVAATENNAAKPPRRYAKRRYAKRQHVTRRLASLPLEYRD
jgi:hypothetical protein